jgi:transketolase
MVIDGHRFSDILTAYEKALSIKDRPSMIIAHTLKGKGVSLVEDKNGFHGKPLSEEELKRTLAEMGDIDRSVRGEIKKPEDLRPHNMTAGKIKDPEYAPDKAVATRSAYGNALKRIFPAYPDMVVLDGEVSNSTMSDVFGKEYPDRFFEMYIAEQNMAGVALGFSTRGKVPFASTFAAFWTRAYDQIRMSQYSNGAIRFCGSHAGVSIGEDGASQMGLEDIAMFRTVHESVVLYPSDAVSTERLVEVMAGYNGISYLRTTRGKTPLIYDNNEKFQIGGCKVLRQSGKDTATVIGAGITLHEALAAYEDLKKENIFIRIIDLYSIKPIDTDTLKKAAESTRAFITVEDHYPEGGIGEAVRSALTEERIIVHSLAVRKTPKSGKPEELLDYEEISKVAIIAKVKSF